MRRTFLTLYTPRSYKSQKQTKPLVSEMPLQKTSITEKKTTHHRRYKKQSTYESSESDSDSKYSKSDSESSVVSVSINIGFSRAT